MSKEFKVSDIHRKTVFVVVGVVTSISLHQLQSGAHVVFREPGLRLLLQNMQYNITNKSLDAIAVSQYIKVGLITNQYRLRKIIQIQGDKNGY